MALEYHEFTSLRSTRPAVLPPWAQRLSTTLSTLLFTLHLVLPSISSACKQPISTHYQVDLTTCVIEAPKYCYMSWRKLLKCQMCNKLISCSLKRGIQGVKPQILSASVSQKCSSWHLVAYLIHEYAWHMKVRKSVHLYHTCRCISITYLWFVANIIYDAVYRCLKARKITYKPASFDAVNTSQVP